LVHRYIDSHNTDRPNIVDVPYSTQLLKAQSIYKKSSLLFDSFIKSRFPSEVAIYGSYATGNVGDLAIGQALREALQRAGLQAETFSSKTHCKKSSVDILGGGGLIHDFWPQKLKRNLRHLSKDSMAIGVGVDPIVNKSLKEWAGSKLDQLCLITVRDERSKRILEEYTTTTIYSLADPAFLHSPPKKRPTEGYTGISAKPIGFLSDKYSQERSAEHAFQRMEYDTDISVSEIRNQYRENMKRVREKISRPKGIPFHYQDYSFLTKHLGIDTFNYKYNVRSTLEQVAMSDRMICTRYHSLVFAILCNKPCMAIAYSPKVSELANRAGIPWFMPYEQLDFEFTRPTNRDSILADARKNIDLVMEAIHHQN